jgi:hypothetical protein
MADNLPLHERCKRICGDDKEHCFIGNKKQVECIADMVINKMFGVSSLISISMTESDPEKMREKLSFAVKTMDELITWVKFLQIAGDLRELSALSFGEGVSEKRQETRYPLPEKYREYLLMKVKVGGSFVPVSITNFSRHGIRFICPEPLAPGSVADCVLLSCHRIRKEVSFSVRVKHCSRQGTAFIAGVQTEDISDEDSFDFFRSVHDLIMQTVSKELPEGR